RSPLGELDVDFRYDHFPGQITAESTHLPHVRVTTRQRPWPEMELKLLGDHQAANAALVVAAVEELRRQGMHVSDAAVTAGLANVHWPARLEVLSRRPLVVLDCAHNDASIQALVDTLRQSFPAPIPTNGSARGGRRLLVFASSSDKDVPGILRTLGPHFGHA